MEILMDIQQNTWEEFYETSGENGMMQYPFGVVIEFIKTYLSRHCRGGVVGYKIYKSYIITFCLFNSKIS